MAHSTLQFDLQLAQQVNADTLEPHQRKTAPNFKIACDFRQQVMLKHPFLSDFHSRAEYLHAGLLEGDPDVTSYIPQPFLVSIRGSWYTPDCYVVSDSQRRRVIELKPRGEMPEDRQVPLTHYFAQYGMQFEVISNEVMYEREIEAENWLEIVRILHFSRDLITTNAEQTVMDTLYDKGECTLGNLIDSGDRERTYLQEIALFRLLHRGHVVAKLAERPLDFDTELALCA